MRFHLGQFPESATFFPDDTWRPIEEPSIRSLQLTALPIGIASFVLVFGLWLMFTPLWTVLQSTHFPLPIHYFAACLVGVLIVHELLHALTHYGMGFSDNTVIGFWPSRVILYASYIEKQTRRRIIVTLITPFLIISIVPLIIAAFLHVAPFWIAYSSVLNAFVSCGDMLFLWVTMKYVPAGTYVQNKDGKTYVTDIT